MSTPENADWERVALERGWTPPPPPPPADHCAVCGETDYCLTDVTVHVAYNEEGDSEVRQYRCDEHLDELLDALRGLGFASHEHGTMAMLEDQSCPGYENPDACPTPSGYGLYVIARAAPIGREEA